MSLAWSIGPTAWIAPLALVGVLGSVGGAAIAAQSVRFMTGETLHAMASSSDGLAQASARSYVLGVLDGLMHLRDPKICIGVEVPADTVYGTVAQTLAQRPDLRRYNAASLVREIISTQYPCT
ncbi:MAG: Rap1a immunity protein [Pseudomonadota bacterium]